MLGGIATICGFCSYKWTQSPAVSRSWPCPECGGPAAGNAAEHACTCGHVLGEHRGKRVVAASRDAFGLAFDEHGMLARVLETEPEETSEIGTCTLCACPCFAFVPPLLTAAAFIAQLETYSRRGARAIGVAVVRLDENALQFARDRRSVVARVSGVATLNLVLENGEKMLTFRMGRSTVGDVTIAILNELEREP